MFGESCCVLKDPSDLFYFSFYNKIYMLNNFLWGYVTQKRQWQNHGCVALSCLCSFVSLNFIADIPEVLFPWAFKSVALCDLCIRCTRRFCWNCYEINLDFLGYIGDAVPTAATQLRQAKGRACFCFPAISHCSSGLICGRALPSRVFSPIPAAQSLFPPNMFCLDNLPPGVRSLLYICNWSLMVLSS